MGLEVELAEIRDFLAEHEPFDGLPDAVLDTLPGSLSVEYFRRGSQLIAKGRDNHHLYVLRSGAVEVIDAQGTLVDRGGAGSCHGSITLTQGNPSTFDVTAIEDTLALLLPAELFHHLCSQHPDFDAFFDAQRRHRMRTAVAELQVTGGGSAILKTRVRDIITREPIVVPRTATVREAAQAMSEHRVSSLLVMDGERLAGIVTDRDLRTRVVAAGLDGGVPVTEVMTADPVTGSEDALAFQVLLEMVGRTIHHLPLVDAHGAPVGLVSTTDLLRLEQSNPVYLAGDIGKQDTVEGIARIVERLPRVVEALVRQDATADDVGRVVTSVGDAVEQRLIALAEADLGPPPVPYCWVTLGSRARLEQALAADQDTAMIIDDAVTPEQQQWFERLANRVVDGLEACGYPRCKGDAMATNPRWRRPLAQWREEFGHWMRRPEPEALLTASIFFDMRPVSGDATLHARLQDFVVETAPGASIFLAHLAAHVSRNEPPLGFFRNFVLEKHGEHRDTLDIKKGGILGIVELARVHGLAVGSRSVNTLARLQDARDGGVISHELADDLRDAFEFIGYVRLRHQAEQVRAGRPLDNHVAPDSLSSFEKRHLREAFGIVRSAHNALGQRYPVRFLS
jgi:CBS domain-containing protein